MGSRRTPLNRPQRRKKKNIQQIVRVILSVGERQNRENRKEESCGFESLMLRLTGGTRDKNKRNGVKRLETVAIDWKGRERGRKGTDEGVKGGAAA